ncbi:MAG: single-stranded DNA-binding protein [Phycisphaerae bacterium]
MANYNKVILVGNLTRDPQLKYLPSETAVVEFGLAVNRRWTGNDGQKREETCFVDVSAFGKPAETINHYMKKGNSILIEGRLHFQQWQAQDGSKRSKLSVVADNFQFMGGPAAGTREGNSAEAGVRPPMRTTRGPQGAPSDEVPPPDNIPEPEEDTPQAPNTKSDIPF